MELGVVNALAHIVTVVRVGRGRGQEWLPCARVLWNWLHNPRSNPAAQRNAGVARSERRALQVNGFHSYLEQPVRVGGDVRLHMA